MFMATVSLGVLESCSLALAPLALPTEDIGAALGALGSIRSGGASIALAIYVAILNNKLVALVPPRVSEAATAAGLPASSLTALLTGLSTGVGLDEVPGITPEILAAAVTAQSGAAADAFRYALLLLRLKGAQLSKSLMLTCGCRFVWYAVIAFAVLAVGCSFLTINYGHLLTDDVSRKMHGKTVGVVEGSEKEHEQVEIKREMV